MGKTIKFKNNVYMGTTGIMVKRSQNKTLYNFLRRVDTLFLNTTTSSVEEYYYLGTLYNNGNGDSTLCRITGTGGGYVYNTQATFDVTLSSRGVGGYGVWYGNNNAWSYFDIKMYKGTDGLYRVYYHRKNVSYHGNDTLFVYSGGGYDDTINSTPVIPNGTLVKTFDNSNMTFIG